MLALLLMATVASASPTSEGAVPLEEALDMARWEAAGRVLIDGPAGCIEVRGRADVDMAFYRPGGWLGPGETTHLRAGGPFEGRLERGLWTRLIVDWQDRQGENPFDEDKDGDGDDLDMDLYPIVGRTSEATDRGKPPEAADEEGSVSISVSGEGTDVAIAEGGEQAMGILDTIVAELDADVNLSFSGWDPDRQAIVLQQIVPVNKSASEVYQVTTLFPGGGAPTRLDAVFPARMRFDADDFPVKITLLNGQLHVRGEETALGVVPKEEGGSVVVGVLGYTVGVDQVVRYTAVRACP